MRLEDFRTATWKRLSQTIQERVDELRKLNDNPSYGVEQTALIRGGISELNKILSLAQDASLGPAINPDELAGVDDESQ